MGLLDDAIREHLELKRLRGADPGEVAREQREALDPVPRDGRHGEENEHDAPEPERGADFSHVGQETAELDMRMVLGEEPGIAEDGPRARSVEEESGDLEEAAEDVLEETPDFLRDTPEQDRLWFEQQPPRDFDFDK